MEPIVSTDDHGDGHDHGGGDDDDDENDDDDNENNDVNDGPTV